MKLNIICEKNAQIFKKKQKTLTFGLFKLFKFFKKPKT